MVLFSKFMVWGLVQLELFWELSDLTGCDLSRVRVIHAQSFGLLGLNEWNVVHEHSQP